MKNYLRQFQSMNRGLPKQTIYIYGTILALLSIVILKKIFLNPQILIIVIALFCAVILHEVAHGYTAFLMGDPTAKIAGRLTLNPKKHIDPVGTIVPIVLILMGSPVIIGWAKPVPVNYSLLKRTKKGILLVALAGVFVNMINALVGATILKFLPKAKITEILISVLHGVNVNIFIGINAIVLFLVYFVLINIALAIFNLIPIPPLDGSRVVLAFANMKVRRILNAMEKYGFIIIIVLLYLGLLDMIIEPTFNFVIQNLVKYIGLI